MQASLEQKLQTLVERYQYLGEQMGAPEVIAEQNKLRDYGKEYSRLEPIVNCFRAFQEAKENSAAATQMLQEDDKEIQAMAQEELDAANTQMETLEQELKILLLPQDPDDSRNIYLEIRAGAGGDEAAIFAGDLFRMYTRFAENARWQVEVISEHASGQGGYKEVICKLSGKDVYAKLKFESGAHRVQRVPETESQGRIHTSTCTVAVLPVVEEIDEIDLDMNDVRVDTFRASGAGGQHVNKTDSAIRMTHIPTGIVVECQEERSQHKNRAKAMSFLQARLLAEEKNKQQKEQTEARRSLVGTGDRSERIRTYNFPQGRLTDHRINLTLYQLEAIMEGELMPVIEPLVREHQANLLANIGDDE